jgi:hypothetical protein
VEDLLEFLHAVP